MKAGKDGSACGTSGALRIAGVPIIVLNPPARGLKVFGSLYRRFVQGGPTDDNGPAITIAMKHSPPPALAGMKKIFDTRESWALLDDGRRLWAVYHPPMHAEPFWVAGFDRRVKRVEYFCPSGGESLHPADYPLDQLLLMYYFARRRGLLAHAAGMVLKGKAYLFAGASGAGKSTFSLLQAAARVGKMLSDERMIVREISGEMVAFGTPWAGTAGIARKGSAPLAGIFFLTHGKRNQIKKMDPAAAADRMLPMISIPWYDPDSAAQIIAFAKRVFAAVPAYEFSFTPDSVAVDCFKEFLKNETGPRLKTGRQRQK
jgi:hypothetical protein